MTAVRRLSVRHVTHYDYDAPVEVAHHSARLRPRDTEWQRVSGWQLDIEPAPECAPQQSQDAFGNWRHGFSHSRVHERLTVSSSFEAVLDPMPMPMPASDGGVIAPGPPWEQVAHELSYRAGTQQPDAVAFALGTPFAPRDERLLAFGQGLFTPGCALREVALALMSRVHERMRYQPHTTDVATDALQALAQGRGVCQDFAHLMIGTLRSQGLAARYVSGYLLTQPPPGRERLVGADASHAWVGRRPAHEQRRAVRQACPRRRARALGERGGVGARRTRR